MLIEQEQRAESASTRERRMREALALSKRLADDYRARQAASALTAGSEPSSTSAGLERDPAPPGCGREGGSGYAASQQATELVPMLRLRGLLFYSDDSTESTIVTVLSSELLKYCVSRLCQLITVLRWGCTE